MVNKKQMQYSCFRFGLVYGV